MWNAIATALLLILCHLSLLFVTRCIYLLSRLGSERGKLKGRGRVATMIVIGSGGHTREMVKIIEHLNVRRFSPRIYVMADTDTSSRSKIIAVEESKRKNYEAGQGDIGDAGDGDYCEFEICRIPRSREVHQGYASSVLSTLWASVYAVALVLRCKPEVILCNGPGTCVPICVAAFAARVFYLSNNVIIFVESFCRVKTLSLTGKIMKYLADEIIVQWPELQLRGPSSSFLDRRFTYLGDDDDELKT